ncbi:hypothetical protein E2C01_003912 [Portunus trituberculatus]|uniref:Uncharacterized protein n=1 Tax=Portunus trituberculatus TaxID=210409 RepID=A0A5B7CP44_PORTR|nr:hypothetical protein [Portunus trituberculatus]
MGEKMCTFPSTFPSLLPACHCGLCLAGGGAWAQQQVRQSPPCSEINYGKVDSTEPAKLLPRTICVQQG